jgi:hypothetical protein
MKVFDNRFGVTADTPLHSFTEGRIKFTRESRPVTVTLRSAKGDELELPGEAWAPSIFGLDHPEFRIRVKTGHINIVARPSDIESGLETQLDVQFDTVAPKPFLDQLGILTLINWAQVGPVSAKISIEEGPLFSATITLDEQLEDWAENGWICAKYILDVLGRQKCEEVQFALSDLNSVMHEHMIIALLSNSSTIRFEGIFDGNITAFDKLSGFSYGAFGDWTYGLIHEMPVTAQSVKDGKGILSLANPTIVRRAVFKRPLIDSKQYISDEFQRYLGEQVGAVATLEDGDLTAWGVRYSEGGDINVKVHA